MTIKEVAQITGLSHQAIYKKIKSHGLKVETLKDKKTGVFTEEGEKQIRELFSIDNSCQPVDKRVEKVDNELSTEVEKLRTQVEALEKQITALTEERDFLRTSLTNTNEALINAQRLQAATLAKVPLLTSGEPGPIRRAWDKLRRRKGEK